MAVACRGGLPHSLFTKYYLNYQTRIDFFFGYCLKMLSIYFRPCCRRIKTYCKLPNPRVVRLLLSTEEHLPIRPKTFSDLYEKKLLLDTVMLTRTWDPRPRPRPRPWGIKAKAKAKDLGPKAKPWDVKANNKKPKAKADSGQKLYWQEHYWVTVF